MRNPSWRGGAREDNGDKFRPTNVTSLVAALQESRIVNLARHRFRLQARDALIAGLECRDDQLARCAHRAIVDLVTGGTA